MGEKKRSRFWKKTEVEETSHSFGLSWNPPTTHSLSLFPYQSFIGYSVVLTLFLSVFFRSPYLNCFVLFHEGYYHLKSWNFKWFFGVSYWVRIVIGEEFWERLQLEVVRDLVRQEILHLGLSRSGFSFLVSNMGSSEEKVVAVIMVGGPTKGEI